LLTGAGSGIGRAVAVQLAREGVPMILAGRPISTEATRRLVLDAGGRAEVFPCDLEDHARIREELPALVSSKKAQRWGVVLAASTLDAEAGRTDAGEFDRVFRTNVTGNLSVLEACLPQMLQQRSGRVVFFAGGGAAYAYPAFPGYALSKVSTVRLVENLAATHGAECGVSFVCVAPGAVDTPMLARVVAAGGEVKTKTAIEEPVEFVRSYLASSSMALNGRYVHVRDEWRAVLEGSCKLSADQFFLRRVS
jgi:NAD(P)-dependent dehydrogenase (short-subunit alcohol dehydrogenase family)